MVPLLVRESRSPDTERILREDTGMVVWWATRSECIHALARRSQDGTIEPLGHARARVRLHRLTRVWTEMQPVLGLRALAETFLYRHPLSTADAYQLAAAFRWRSGDPRGADFVCLDGRLRDAAEAEGFSILPAS